MNYHNKKEQEKIEASAQQLSNLNEKIKAYQVVFATDHGKLVLKDLKERFGFGATPYEPGMTSLDMGFHNGRQSSINHIVHMVEREEVKKI